MVECASSDGENSKRRHVNVTPSSAATSFGSGSRTAAPPEPKEKHLPGVRDCSRVKRRDRFAPICFLGRNRRGCDSRRVTANDRLVIEIATLQHEKTSHPRQSPAAPVRHRYIYAEPRRGALARWPDADRHAASHRALGAESGPAGGH